MELANASAELSSFYEPAVEDDRRMRNPLYAATECAEDQLLKAPTPMQPLGMEGTVA